MRVVRAARILTMDPTCPEIRDGGLLVDQGRVVAVEPWTDVRRDGELLDLGAVTMVPGLINAHAHLGLSHLAGRVSAGTGFLAWADALFGLLREELNVVSVRQAVATMRHSGVCCVADVVGGDGAVIARELAAIGLGGVLIREFSGSGGRGPFCPRAVEGPWSCGVHALYSTQGDFAARIKKWCVAHGRVFSLHLAEVPGENELFRHGTGAFAEFVRSRRLLPRHFVPPGLSAVGFARELGLLDVGTLAVHCVHVDAEDVEILAATRTAVCLCPRSNAWIGVGTAPVRELAEAGIRLCLGTDSLASNSSLDLWAELRAVGALLGGKEGVAHLLPLVTSNPACALGIDQDYGSLQAGKRAAWAVLPEDLSAQA